MISEDLNGFLWLGSYKLWFPYLKGADDCEELFIVDYIVCFSRGHLLREEGNRFQYVSIYLGKDTCGDKVRGVGFYLRFLFRVVVGEDRSSGEGFF